MKRLSHLGFSLLELLVTVAIVAILAAVAYPSYTTYIQKAHRADAQGGLLKIQSAFEQYNAQYGSYPATIASAYGGTSPALSQYYNFDCSTNAAGTSYMLTATATGIQTADTSCTTLTLTNLDDQGATPAANSSLCWGQ